MTESSNVHTAIIKVMQEVGYVQKQKAQGLPYKFTGEAAYIAALRPAMVDNGLYIYPIGVEVSNQVFTTSGNKSMNYCVGQFAYRIHHAPSNTNIDIVTGGSGMDGGDKAPYKAMTGAFKYALRQSFLIETGDDPDKERPGEGPEPKRELPGRPWQTDMMKHNFTIAAQFYKNKETVATDSHRGLLVGLSNQIFNGNEDRRRTLFFSLCPGSRSIHDLDDWEVIAMLRWIDAEKLKAPEKGYLIAPHIYTEANLLVEEQIQKSGGLIKKAEGAEPMTQQDAFPSESTKDDDLPF